MATFSPVTSIVASDKAGDKELSVHGPGKTGEDQIWDPLDWYLTPVPEERCEPASLTAAKATAAERTKRDVEALLSLSDDIIANSLARLPLDDLARLAKLSALALSRVVPVGQPSPVVTEPVKPAMKPAMKPTFPTDLPVVVEETPSTEAELAKEPAKEPVTLVAKKWVDLPLEAYTEINHNTLRLRFKLPTRQLGLPVGMHIFLKARVGEKACIRAYTPVGFGDYYVEFIIKVYFPLPPKFPEGGKLTQHMHAMKLGDTLSFKGPLGELDFDENFGTAALAAPRTAPVSFQHNGAPGGSMRQVGFIAGGSGITPCLQVANALLTLERDVEIRLLYANQSPDDILCHEEIAEIAKDPRVKVWYTVDRPTPGWEYSTGFIDEAMCREHLPLPSDETFIFMCGPPPMLKFACRPNLQEKIGHKEAQVLAF